MPFILPELPQLIIKKIRELEKDIEFRQLDSKGANGIVLIGNNRLLNRDVVVKFYYWGDGAHAEPALLAGLASDYILQVYHAESLSKDDAYFMTPYCSDGDLDDALAERPFGTVEAIDVISQISAGASYLHGCGYLHRDLKPANIFCDSNGRFVIGDFGSVVRQNAAGYANTQTRHSLLYRPPEEILAKKFYRQGDIYQLGMILFQALGGNLPYEESAWLNGGQKTKYKSLSGWEQQDFARNVIEKRICRGQILDYSSLPAWVPQKLKTIIRRCCNVSWNDRFGTVADLTAKLNNIRGEVADWRTGEFPTLYRKKKQFRIVKSGATYRIEKSVGNQWRVERAYAPTSLAEAVSTAELLT